jgi:3',5'-cyclic-AMP phosphodiesterase
MNCCGPTRRQALLWGGLAATAATLASGGTAVAAGGDLLVQDLEVVTVTDTSVVITWFTGSPTAKDAFGFPEPVGADTELQLGTVDPTTLTVVPGSLKTVFHNTTATPYH